MDKTIEERLARFLPIYVGLRLEEEKIEGRTEHSFSMEWSTARVRLFWSGKAYSIIGELTLNGQKRRKAQYDFVPQQ